MTGFILREVHGTTLQTAMRGPERRNAVDVEKLGIASVLARRGRQFGGGINS